MLIEWRDSHKLGNAEMDEQHQELFARVNLFLDAADTISQMKYLIGLFKFTRLHFSHEEDLMRRANYPETSLHLDEHAELLDRLSAFADSVANNTFVKEFWGNFLAGWLINHIASSDTKLADFVKPPLALAGHAADLSHQKQQGRTTL